MCLQALETVEIEALSAMQLNAEHRSGSGVLPLVTIMLRNSVDVEYRDGVVKLLCVNGDGEERHSCCGDGVCDERAPVARGRSQNAG